MARRRWNYETIQQVLDGENPFIQSGYSEAKVRHKNGDEWTDSKGKSWKMENGAISSVNKQMDAIREMIKQKCSVCGQRMDFSNDKLDHKVFPKTGKCFDCLQVEELEYRMDRNKWATYEEKKLLSNKIGALKDFKEKVVEAIEYLKNDNGKMGDVLASGEIVTYTGTSNPQWLVDAERDLVKVNEEIKKMEEVYSNLENVLK